MVHKIKQKLDEYLEFDSKLILNYNLLSRVFGGAIRDIIADVKINDIDILIGAKSFKVIRKVLIENGYSYIESLHPKDLSEVYKDISVISEPHTFMKGLKIVQLIRPRNKNYAFLEQAYKKNFKRLLQNVDISCCGVSYDGEYLYENYPGAVSHCEFKYFEINEKASMYNKKRIEHRKYKLIERGWSIKKETKFKRDLKINQILDKQDISYKKEYDENFLNKL